MKKRFATPCERVRPTRTRKSCEGIRKDRLFYSLETSGKRSSHIPASKRVNLKTSGLRKLRFNLRENILQIIYPLCMFSKVFPNIPVQPGPKIFNTALSKFYVFNVDSA